MPLIHHLPPPVTATERQPGQLLQGRAESCGMEGCWQVKRGPLHSSTKPFPHQTDTESNKLPHNPHENHMKKTLMETEAKHEFDPIYDVCFSANIFLFTLLFPDIQSVAETPISTWDSNPLSLQEGFKGNSAECNPTLLYRIGISLTVTFLPCASCIICC